MSDPVTTPEQTTPEPLRPCEHGHQWQSVSLPNGSVVALCQKCGVQAPQELRRAGARYVEELRKA